MGSVENQWLLILQCCISCPCLVGFVVATVNMSLCQDLVDVDLGNVWQIFTRLVNSFSSPSSISCSLCVGIQRPAMAAIALLCPLSSSLWYL